MICVKSLNQRQHQSPQALHCRWYLRANFPRYGRHVPITTCRSASKVYLLPLCNGSLMLRGPSDGVTRSWEITNTELALHDGRRMRRDSARIDQGVCITSHASQCRTVDQVVALPDGADAKGWYVSLSRARVAMHVFTRNKTELRRSVMQPGERKSVWELLRAEPRSKVQSRDQMMPNLWATRQSQMVRETEMER